MRNDSSKQARSKEGGDRGVVNGDGQTGRVGEDGLGAEPQFYHCRV